MYNIEMFVHFGEYIL